MEKYSMMSFAFMVVAFGLKVTLYIFEIIIQSRIMRACRSIVNTSDNPGVYFKVYKKVYGHASVKWLIPIVDVISYLSAFVAVGISYMSANSISENYIGDTYTSELLLLALVTIVVLDTFARSHKHEFGSDIVNELMLIYMDKVASEKEADSIMEMKKMRAKERREQAKRDMKMLDEMEKEKGSETNITDKVDGKNDELISQILTEYLG